MEKPLINLQQKFKKTDIQPGGKGSMRRKKIPSNRSKKPTESDELLTILKVPKLINIACETHLRSDKIEESNRYLFIFTSEFYNVISKAHRKSNRPSIDHYTTIRKKLEEYFVIQYDEDSCTNENGEKELGFHVNLTNYATKNLSSQALKQFLVVLEACKAIIETSEYMGYLENIVPKSDRELAQLYRILKMDFSVKMMPTHLRNHYLKQLSGIELNKKEERSQLKSAYFSIIKLITEGASKSSSEEAQTNQVEIDELIKDSHPL